MENLSKSGTLTEDKADLQNDIWYVYAIKRNEIEFLQRVWVFYKNRANKRVHNIGKLTNYGQLAV